MEPAPLRILLDGACPVCRREGDLLRRLDRGRGRLALEDISAPSFDPARFGLTSQQVVDQIHALDPSGRVIVGMEVFRRAYAAVGLGWLLAPTAWPLLRPVFDRLYLLFARNRVRWFGGSTCAGGACAVRRA
ncbi:MAG: DUF393 domain-containing protein [Planctomycetota bacterium]|nr:DUF393 domain-containing protein [Planctomycetota bacterium]